MSAELLARARAGDRDAFTALVEPHRAELQAHCYRMLGSLPDAEDALQETLLSAWIGIDSFEGHSSVRTWLYRVATNRCLSMLRSSSRRPVSVEPRPDWLTLQPLAGDLHVQKPEKPAPETKPQRHRALRCVNERGII